MLVLKSEVLKFHLNVTRKIARLLPAYDFLIVAVENFCFSSLLRHNQTRRLMNNDGMHKYLFAFYAMITYYFWDYNN